MVVCSVAEMRLLRGAALLGLASLRVTQARLQVSSSIGSHMVLQRAPAQAVITGFADPDVEVQVTVAGKAAGAATSTATGSFSVVLEAFLAGGPYDVVVTNVESGEALTLTDVLFGEYPCARDSPGCS